MGTVFPMDPEKCKALVAMAPELEELPEVEPPVSRA